MRKQSSEFDKPIHKLDVNLGARGIQSINIFKGDSAGKLADDFAKKHNLQVEQKVKLMLILNLKIEDYN